MDENLPEVCCLQVPDQNRIKFGNWYSGGATYRPATVLQFVKSYHLGGGTSLRTNRGTIKLPVQHSLQIQVR